MILRFALSFILGAAIVGSVSAVKSGTGAPYGAPLSLKTPAERFVEYERQLHESDNLTIEFTTSSTGAFVADLKGRLMLSDGNSVRLFATGTFAGDSVELRLESDGTRMTGGNGKQSFDQESPPGLYEAVVIGMTRMGILHNLARLVAGALPDHAGGGVREWVVADSIRATTPKDETAADVIYDLVVSGERSAKVGLRLDGSSWPMSRTLLVQFPGGSMNVVETYRYSTEEAVTVPKR